MTVKESTCKIQSAVLFIYRVAGDGLMHGQRGGHEAVCEVSASPIWGATVREESCTD